MKEENWENEGYYSVHNDKERNAAGSIVSFFSEKETEDTLGPLVQ